MGSKFKSSKSEYTTLEGIYDSDTYVYISGYKWDLSRAFKKPSMYASIEMRAVHLK